MLCMHQLCYSDIIINLHTETFSNGGEVYDNEEKLYNTILIINILVN